MFQGKNWFVFKLLLLTANATVAGVEVMKQNFSMFFLNCFGAALMFFSILNSVAFEEKNGE